jgi:hypothetical protein
MGAEFSLLEVRDFPDRGRKIPCFVAQGILAVTV